MSHGRKWLYYALSQNFKILHKIKVKDWAFVYLVPSFHINRIKQLDHFANSVGILIAFKKLFRIFTASLKSSIVLTA